jgi:pantoate kinase
VYRRVDMERFVPGDKVKFKQGQEVFAPNDATEDDRAMVYKLLDEDKILIVFDRPIGWGYTDYAGRKWFVDPERIERLID